MYMSNPSVSTLYRLIKSKKTNLGMPKSYKEWRLSFLNLDCSLSPQMINAHAMALVMLIKFNRDHGRSCLLISCYFPYMLEPLFMSTCSFSLNIPGNHCRYHLFQLFI